jgi:hypothetical protein
VREKHYYLAGTGGWNWNDVRKKHYRAGATAQQSNTVFVRCPVPGRVASSSLAPCPVNFFFFFFFEEFALLTSALPFFGDSEFN